MSTPPLPVHRHRRHDRTQLHRTDYRPPRGRGADRGRASDLAWVEVLEGWNADGRQVADPKRGGSSDPPFLATDQLRSVVHVAHPTHAATTRHSRSFLLRFLRDHCLGGHQQTGD